MSSKDTDEERWKHPKKDKIEIMINDKPDEAIEEFFQSLHSKYQIGLETSMKKGNSSIFDHVYLLYYKCHKTSLNRTGSCIVSSNWIKKQKRNDKFNQ